MGAVSAPALPAAFLHAPVAHRAWHDLAAGRPENSLAAIRAACQKGYGIEIDVQLSADGVVMVFHDDTLDRLTPETGPVETRTAAELAALPLLGTEERVPTFAQVLAEVGGQVPLLVEIKDQSRTMGPVDGRLEAAVAQELAGYSGPVAVMSFNPHSMAHMARLAPDLPRGLTTCSYEGKSWGPTDRELRRRLQAIEDYELVGASFISHEHTDLHSSRVAELKAQGAALLCWTLRSPEDEARARRIADNVTFEGYTAAIPAAG